MNVKPLIAITSICLLLGVGRVSAKEPGLEGRWEGATLVRPGEVEVDFVLTIDRGATEDFQGKISFPSQGAKAYPLDSLVFEGQSVLFVTVDESGVASSFHGALGADGDVEGTVKVRDKSYPFIMKRREAQGGNAAPEVRTLSAKGDEVQDLFNRDADKVRLVIILAPSCGMCRMGARLVQRYVLEEIEDPRLRVYVVWEAIGKEDSEALAGASASFIQDPRVTQFWSSSRFTGQAFQKAVGAPTPAWDVFLLFPAGSRWQKDSPPRPASFMHNLPEVLPADKSLNGRKLAEQVQSLLASPRQEAAAGSGRP